ncbi:MAG: (Fe-S)-binding protein [Bacteroidales bacterium]|nr:(Fe-S)-binding protein [Bacteroidales bacterium]
MTNKYTVNLFVPCCMDLYFPSGVQSVLAVLEKLGDISYYNSEMTCCGRQFFYRGEIEMAKELGYRMIRYFDNPNPVVCPSSACVAYIKKYYKKLCEASSVHSAISHLIQDTYELCDYIVNVKNTTCMNNTFAHRVFLFESCAARNVYYAGDEAKILLQNTKGLELITDPDMKLCCCGNGEFAMHNGEMTEYALKTIVERVKQLNAEFITCTDVHCLQYIDAYLQTRDDLDVSVVPIAEILISNK